MIVGIFVNSNLQSIILAIVFYTHFYACKKVILKLLYFLILWDINCNDADIA